MRFYLTLIISLQAAPEVQHVIKRGQYEERVERGERMTAHGRGVIMSQMIRC